MVDGPKHVDFLKVLVIIFIKASIFNVCQKFNSLNVLKVTVTLNKGKIAFENNKPPPQKKSPYEKNCILVTF